MELRDYVLGEELPQYSSAITPGKHCPLFGVSSVIKYVDHVTAIYLGTRDCVYFAMKQFLTSPADAPTRARVVAAELTDSDIVFGILPSLKKLVQEEYESHHPSIIFIVTSCSVEVISEDVEGCAALLDQQLPCSVRVIRTEHFKTTGYYEGIERTLEAMMTELPPARTDEASFSILGARFPGAETCEPARILKRHGYRLNSNLPFDCREETVSALSQSAFTLVVDCTGIQAAEKLQKAYGIPCFRLDSRFDLEGLEKTYRALSEKTGIPLEEFLADKAEAENWMEKGRKALRGKTFVYSNVMHYAFEGAWFLGELGMIPKCIFIGSALDRTDRFLKKLQEKYNPQLYTNANSDAILAMLDRYEPDYLVGNMMNSQQLLSRGIRHAVLPGVPVECGYRYVAETVRRLVEAESGGKSL